VYRRCQHTALMIMVLLLMAMPAGAAPVSSKQLCSQAENYLVMLDQGRSEEAWQEMSAIFQALGNQSLWLNRQQAIRSAYGPCVSRQFTRIDYRKSYNLSPDGQYFIVQFRSSYQNKLDTVETVVIECHDTPECTIREYIIR